MSAASAFAGTPWTDAADAAAALAPYLKRLLERRTDLLVEIDTQWPERLLRQALAEASAVASDPRDMDHDMRALRRCKDAVHLAVAIADIARAWPLHRVTGALTDFADAALRAALAIGVRERAKHGDIVLDGADPSIVPGYALIAMGKMGAGELNYSSDIDFSVFFDPLALSVAEAREPRVAAVKLVAPIVRVLEEVTPDGYVFRTDLRLRPDPGSTPVAVSIASAEHYYQTLGQNWERAAFIKARAVGGDRDCGRAFLASLEPFIWRKHLDFAAVEDVHSIKRQILSAHKSAELSDPVFDVKLGRGGIRDIELFAQTQQLILGGRNKKLRTHGTVAALDALSEAGVITPSARSAMIDAYTFFREIEHRVQMLQDAQTHHVPRDVETRARVAALAGFESVTAFDAELVRQRKIVSEIDHQLFGRGDSLADPLGSLIFTGVEDHPETLRTIAKLGFSDPAHVSQTIRGWHHGRIRAMRSERARELLTRITPRMLRAFSSAGEADHVFSRFAAFFGGLVAGVQVLALFDARPALLDLLARLFAIAPRLADALARRPALLDALIEQRFLQPLAQDASERYRDELNALLADAGEFEAKLNAARRFHREEAFRVGVQVLDGLANPAEAAAAQSDLAEACVAAMAAAALDETQRLYGAQPGAFLVLALGKFGGRELAMNADLDLMLVYDAPPESGANAAEFYTRFTQRLISALSAPTEEGALYDIDTKLRPSGSKGPVAVRLSSFERYYAEEAWTWELQALTRARPVAGDPSLAARVMDTVRATLTRARAADTIRAEVADMRARMERERRSRGVWDLKLALGGFVDIEFIAQALQLTAAHPAALAANTGEAIRRLCGAGMMEQDVGERLLNAWRTYSDLQQVFRVALDGAFTPETAPAPLMARVRRILGADPVEDVETQLRRLQTAVRADFNQLVGPVGDGNA